MWLILHSLQPPSGLQSCTIKMRMIKLHFSDCVYNAVDDLVSTNQSPPPHLDAKITMMRKLAFAGRHGKPL